MFNNMIEYIIPDKKIYIIHAPGIGRTCIAICKDFLENQYLNFLLEDIKADLIIVPSFSTGSYDFTNQISKCKSYDTDVIWINSCSAKHLTNRKNKNFEIIGEILKSGKNSGEETFFKTNNCNKICDKGICIFENEIQLEYNYERNIYNDK